MRVAVRSPRSIRAYTVALETLRRTAISAGVRYSSPPGRATGAPNGVVPYAFVASGCDSPVAASPGVSEGCLPVPRGAPPWKSPEGPWGGFEATRRCGAEGVWSSP